METHESLNQSVQARILFVDDSKLIRLAARKMLADHFDLVLAENAAQAREIICADPTIQVLFCDLNMPGESGYDLLEYLRESDESRLRELPVIIVTGTDELEQERQRALQVGATDFISKPFRASELLARATAHASHKEAVRRIHRLEQQRHIDPATGLGTRHYCRQRLTQALSFSRRHDQPLTLMHLHLAGLTRLIRELGEPYAGRALEKIGIVLRRIIREEDTVYRTGTSTFCFILPATNSAGAEVLRERFSPDLEALGIHPDGRALGIVCHFSIQEPPLDGSMDSEQILRAGLAPEPARSKRASKVSMDLEDALARLQSGDSESVLDQLPDLMRRLEPLLKLAGHSHLSEAQSQGTRG
jgi:two-component system, cell cycle response regulator